MIVYLIFSYYSIINPNIMINLINSKKMKKVLINNIKKPDPNYNFPFANNYFANKWYNIYIKKIKNNKQLLGTWILAMWCDLMSKYSYTNLKCIVPFRLLMLISSLINNTNNNNNQFEIDLNIINDIHNNNIYNNLYYFDHLTDRQVGENTKDIDIINNIYNSYKPHVINKIKLIETVNKKDKKCDLIIKCN